MKKAVTRIILVLFGLILISILSMCCSMNKLQGYEFRDHTAAALLAYPPPPQIFTDDWTNLDFSNPVQAVIRLGTGMAREAEVSKTRAKMDSAIQMVDIPEIIRIETLERGAQYLHYHPIEDIDESYFLYDIVMKHYGIDAKSWTASVYFKMEVKVTLLDNRRGTEIWRSCFDERFPISREMFGLPDAAGDLINAVSLSRLTAEQIAGGLENLAVHTSDRIIHKLQRDFSKKRQ